MYLEHFGLSEPPFTITPHTDFFFAGANRGATLEALIYAVTHGEGIVKVSGEVGSGKTMLCRVLMERLPESVETIYLAIPSLNRDEMLAAICADLGIVTESSAPNVQLKSLQEHLLRLHGEGRRVVALVDEAHAMPLDSLEEIRLLSNLETNKSKLLQIALFGQPELDEHLAKPQMRQLRERITHSFRLSPLTLEDIEEYLRHRLRAAGYKGAEVFSPACVKLIAKASRGLTRRINIVADKSLLAAFSHDTHSITPVHVRAAIRDSEFATKTLQPKITPWLIGTAMATSLAIGALGTAAIMKNSAPDSVPVATPASPISEKPMQETRTGVTQGATLSNPDPVPKNQPSPVPPEAQRAVPVPTSLPERLASSKAWLSQATASDWIIQLMLANATEEKHLSDFIKESEQAVGTGRIHAYSLSMNGMQKVCVVYGSFQKRVDAEKALALLPLRARQYKPYLRRIQVIRAEAEPNKVPVSTG